LLDGMCEFAYNVAMKFMRSPQEKRGWRVYTQHTLLNGSGDIRLDPSEVLSIAQSFPGIRALVDSQRMRCRKGMTFSFSKNDGGKLKGEPWEYALGGVTIHITTKCDNGCFSYSYEIDDPYDFDVRGIPGFTDRSAKGEAATIAVRATELCLRCNWRVFNHYGTYSGR